MTQMAFMWVALVCGAVVAGLSFVAVLVVQRRAEPVAVAIGALGLLFGVWGFASITTSYDRLDAVFYALVFSVCGVIGGYALGSTLLGALARRTPEPQAPSRLPTHAEKPAVIVLSEVEPARYSAGDTALALEELADEGLIKPSVGVLPFLFMAQKTRYRAAGGTSQGAGQLDELAERLSAVLGQRAASVRAASAEGTSSLVQRTVQAVQDGVRTIVVAEAVIADSLEIDRAKRKVDELRLHELGVSVRYTDPLWCSERIAATVVGRIMAVVNDPSVTGIVLVGQAQPESRMRDARAFDEQETAFLNRLRMLLVDRGVAEQNARIAWADWRTPEVTTSVRHLAALGCRRIVVSPACFALDSIATRLDIPLSVRQARVDESVSIVTLAAWQDDPAVIEELRAGVQGLLDDRPAG